jgi:hypothetical protein
LIASSNLEALKATLPFSLSSSANIAGSSCFFSGNVFSVGVFEPLDEALVVTDGVGMFTGLATEGVGDGEGAALVLPVDLCPFFLLGIVSLARGCGQIACFIYHGYIVTRATIKAICFCNRGYDISSFKILIDSHSI